MATSISQSGTGRRNAVCLAGFLVVFAVLLTLDSTIYEFLHEHFNYATRPVPPVLRLATRLLRSMEDWGEDVFIAAVLFAMWQMDRTRRSRVVGLVLSAVIVSLAVEGTKRIVGRERPEVGRGSLVLRGPVSGEGRGDWHSFPSGHTASAGSYSGSLAAYYPPIRPVCIALAVGCGSSRIWKERHFASDCWFGGVFGFWFAGWLPNRRWMRRFDDWFDARSHHAPS